jgi:hypothetical protein
MDEAKMRKHWMLRASKFALLAGLAVAGFGLLVMGLWNWLMPVLFGWGPLGFWQALGLLVLCRILFGSFGGGAHGRMHLRRRMLERWERMTPEERQKLRERLRRGCGHFDPPEAAPTV